MSAILIRPANEARWEDLQAIFGTRGDPQRCWCQRYKMAPGESWANVGPDALAARMREQTDCGGPDPRATSGLVAYLDGEPAGWCAVEPRAVYGRLRRDTRVPWEGRDEDKADERVWAVTCFVTRAGYRKRGISRALAAAAVEHAHACGAPCCGSTSSARRRRSPRARRPRPPSRSARAAARGCARRACPGRSRAPGA